MSNHPSRPRTSLKPVGLVVLLCAWGLPALNTAILLTSGLTVTLAHWALKRKDNVWLVYWLFATVALGFLFVGLQGYEYIHAFSFYFFFLSAPLWVGPSNNHER